MSGKLCCFAVYKRNILEQQYVIKTCAEGLGAVELCEPQGYK